MTGHSLILASASPRRRQLLEQIGLTFDVLVSGVDEIRRAGESPKDYALRNAEEKSASVLERALGAAPAAGGGRGEPLVLAADTIVVLPGEVLEKPRDAAEARAMLSRLSGATHTVITSFVLRTRAGLVHREAVESGVTFRALEPEEIDAYIATGEPFDKAGGYGIQGHALGFVHSISGSYSNIVGLPVSHLCQAFRRHGIVLRGST